MQVSSTTMKEVNERKGPDQIIVIKVDRKVISLRVLRFILDSGFNFYTKKKSGKLTI
jgi:hypothetical protein